MATSSPQITLGINTCFAVKRWSRPEQWARIVSDELGLSDVQFSMDLFPPSASESAVETHADEVREVAEAHGIRVRSVFTGLAAYASNLLLADTPSERAAAEGWYRRMIDLTARIGADGVGGHIGAFTVASFRDATRRDGLRSELIEHLTRISDHASDAGLQYLLFENLALAREPGYSISESHELEAALSDCVTPWRLCLDLGHPAALHTGTPSDEPIAWLNEGWQNAPIIQLQQSPRGGDHHAAFTAANNATGLVHRDEVIPALLTWDAPEIEVHLEVIPAHEADDDQVIADLVESVRYWQDGIEQHAS
ncbi:sugar phosphate isomerase/epimerase family protein [Microbacterium sp. AGC85]